MMRDTPEARTAQAVGKGRLSAAPPSAPASSWDGPVGEAVPIDTGGEQRGPLLYVPVVYRAERPAALALLLHGAGGHAAHGLGLLQAEADAAGLILVAAASRHQTWDAIRGSFGPDVAEIDRVLEHVFARLWVDSAHLAVGGFSDGASYALSLGITNGDLFSHVIAFSPGFMAPGGRHGRPRVFASHGTRDETLPIDSCSRRLVPALRHAGYDVDYQEFDGPHTVPARIAGQAVTWFLEDIQE